MRIVRKFWIACLLIWEQSRVNKIRRYYVASIKQVDYDIMDMDVHRDYTLMLEIKEMQMYVPTWLKNILNYQIERYYERRIHMKT